MVTITKYVWDPVFDCVTHELDENNNVKAEYHNEPQPYGGVLSQRRGTTTHYHHHDALGSTRFLTDNSGNVTDTYLHDAWGNLVASTGTTINPFKWVGKYGYYTDNSTAQVYVRARMYQPKVARWCSEDPIHVLYGDHYQYSRLLPISEIDSSGELCLAQCGPDVTNWFKRQLQLLHDYRHNNLFIVDKEYQTLMKSMKFELSHNGHAPTTKQCPSQECKNSVTLCGKCVNVTDLGKISYGYVADFSLAVTLWGGLYAEVATDRPRGIDKYADLFPILCGYARSQVFMKQITFPNSSPSIGEKHDICYYMNNQVGGVGAPLAFTIEDLYLANTAWRIKSGQDVLALWKKKHGQDPIRWLEEGIRQFESLKHGCAEFRNKESPAESCKPCASSFFGLDLRINTDGTITWGDVLEQ